MRTLLLVAALALVVAVAACGVVTAVVVSHMSQPCSVQL